MGKEGIEMKKGFAGIVAAMLLVFTMGTTVFAASFPSPDESTLLNEQAKKWNENVTNATATDSNNNQYTVTKSQVSADVVSNAHNTVKNIDSNGEIIGMSDLSINGTIGTKGIKVTLAIPGGSVKSGYQVYVLHRLSDGRWETLKPSSVSNGKVTVTLYSLSPVAVVQYPASSNIGVSDPSKNQGSNGDSTVTDTDNNSHNTTGDSLNNSQSNSQPNNNNQSNSQSNPQTNNQTQNNPVNVTVNYPGQNVNTAANSTPGKRTSSSAATNSTNSSAATNGAATSPKTGASLPALPILAVFALTFGIAVCGKKARSH